MKPVQNNPQRSREMSLEARLDSKVKRQCVVESKPIKRWPMMQPTPPSPHTSKQRSGKRLTPLRKADSAVCPSSKKRKDSPKIKQASGKKLVDVKFSDGASHSFELTKFSVHQHKGLDRLNMSQLYVDGGDALKKCQIEAK